MLYKGISVPVLLGCGAFEQLAQVLQNHVCRKVFVIHDGVLEQTGVLARLRQQLDDAGIVCHYFDKVLPDPPDTVIEAVAGRALACGVDSVVGVGGGSAMDTAKAVNILLGNPPPIQQYFAPCDKPVMMGKPLFLIPTTAGTGSEATSYSVLTDTAAGNKKSSINDPACLATVAIVDPGLMATMPQGLTAATGMDAFAHAAEALTSSGATVLSDVWAKEALRLVFRHLEPAVLDGGNLAAREQMAYASTMAGFAFTNASVHLGHAIAHVLGGEYHITHGVACANTLVPVMRWVGAVQPELAARVLACLDVPVESNAGVGGVLADVIHGLNRTIGVPTIRQMLPHANSLSHLIPAIRAQRAMSAIPHAVTDAQLVTILEELVSDDGTA